MSPAEIAALSDADLARTLMAHPRWEWRAGMRCGSAHDVDLNDDATAGVLLGMLTAELGGRWPVALCALLDDDIEATVLGGGALRGELPTLGVALARALLAAWGSP